MTDLAHVTDAERIREIAQVLRLEAVRIIALERYIDTGDTQATLDALNTVKEGYAVRLIRGAAVEAIAVACTRACDRVDSKSDRHSIPVAKKLLGNKSTFELVATPPGNREALVRFMSFADEISVSYPHETLRAFRDYRIAHNLPKQFSDADKAQINHLWDLEEGVLKAIYNLSVGTGINLVSMDAEARIWGERCEAYWRRLLAGPPGQAIRKVDR